MVTGQELLAAVEACKHFAQIIHGCKIWIHVDHQILMHDDSHHTNLQEQCAQIFLNAEFQPPFVHTKGTDNMAADGLSQLSMADNDVAINQDFKSSGIFLLVGKLDRKLNNDFPLDMQQIMLCRTQICKGDTTININGNVVATFNGKVLVITIEVRETRHEGVTNAMKIAPSRIFFVQISIGLTFPERLSCTHLQMEFS
jgi:hypothetical protein